MTDALSGDPRLADRIAIQDALYRYVRGVDRRDWPLVRSAYHADAIDHHGDYHGDIDGFVSRLAVRHEHIVQSMHCVSNVFIEFDSADGAVVESYFIVYQRHSPEAGESRRAYLPPGHALKPDDAVECEVMGRYADRFTRRDGEWKIARRAVVYEINRAHTAPADRRLKDNWAIGTRDGNDPIEVMRREVGL